MTRPSLDKAQPSDSGDQGSITLYLTLVLFGAAITFAALLFDQSRVLHANADAFDLAGKAARVGAQQLDPSALAHGTVRIDPASARAEAQAYLQAHAIADSQVAITGATVTITVHQHIPFRIPVLSGHSGATVTQTRSATATTGP